jgi:hypothetical protein
LAQSYAQTPLLTAVLPPLREIIKQPWTRLVDLDLAPIGWLAKQLAITTPWHRAFALDIAGDATIGCSICAAALGRRVIPILSLSDRLLPSRVSRWT